MFYYRAYLFIHAFVLILIATDEPWHYHLSPENQSGPSLFFFDLYIFTLRICDWKIFPGKIWHDMNFKHLLNHIFSYFYDIQFVQTAIFVTESKDRVNWRYIVQCAELQLKRCLHGYISNKIWSFHLLSWLRKYLNCYSGKTESIIKPP